MTPERTCSRCKRTFPATPEFFRRDSDKPLGITYYCHECARSRSRERTAISPPEEREKRRLYSLAYIKAIHLRCLRAYGGDPPRCACCGETELAFLTIDHIAGDGTAHRNQLEAMEGRRMAGYVFYRWLEKNGFPPGLQCLCWNCNVAKRTYRACPHQPGGGNLTRHIIQAAYEHDSRSAGQMALSFAGAVPDDPRVR